MRAWPDLTTHLSNISERAARAKLKEIVARRRVGRGPETRHPLENASRMERSESYMRNAAAQPIRWAQHQRSWFAHCEEAWGAGLGAGILSPYNHGKTSFAIAMLLEEIHRNQNVLSQVISETKEIAVERVGSVKQYIEESAEYRAMSPLVEPDQRLWGAVRLRVKRKSASPDPTLAAFGIISGGTGKRSLFSLYEDPIGISSLSAKIRKATWDRFTNTWETRVEPEGRRLYIGTAYHIDDLAHTLIRTPGWCWLIQGIADDESCIESIRFDEHGSRPLSLAA